MRKSIIIISFIIVCGVILMPNAISYRFGQERALESSFEPYSKSYEVISDDTKWLITIMAKENRFDVNTALRIADCESDYGLNKFNKYSSAKGTYQFIDKTWENYCEGEVLNNYDNIKCFIKLYKKHPTWWECN